MRTLFFTAFFVLVSMVSIDAQTHEEQLQEDLDLIETQLAEAFSLLEQQLLSGQLFHEMDTAMLRMIPELSEIPESQMWVDPDELHDMLDQFMEAFTAEHLDELEEYFDELEPEILENPEMEDQSSTAPKEEKSKKKPKKKTKVYTL